MIVHTDPASLKTSATDAPALPLYLRALATPIGELSLVACEHGLLRAVAFSEPPQARPLHKRAVPAQAEATLHAASLQLTEYFAAERVRFELALGPVGTAFQREVWDALTAIPYGQTRSYAELASAVGRPQAMRAVGAANGKNPLPIVVPCHRVVGSDGSLTGYAGGLRRKRYLLALEAASGATARAAAQPANA